MKHGIKPCPVSRGNRVRSRLVCWSKRGQAEDAMRMCRKVKHAWKGVVQKFDGMFRSCCIHVHPRQCAQFDKLHLLRPKLRQRRRLQALVCCVAHPQRSRFCGKRLHRTERAHEGLRASNVFMLMMLCGSPVGVSNDGRRRSTSSAVRCTYISSPVSSYAASMPPATRIVVSNTEAS